MHLSQRMGVFIASAALAVSLTTAATAQRAGRGRGASVITLMTKLQLTDEQKSKLQPALDAFRAENTRIRDITDRAEAMAARQKATETLEAATKDVLTPDQQKKLEALRAELREYAELGPLASRLVGLNLAAEQKTKIKEIGAKYQPDLQKQREEQRNATDRQAAAQQGRELNMKIAGEIRAVLNADQQKAFDEAAPRRRNGNNNN